MKILKPAYTNKPKKRKGRSRKGEGSLKLRGNTWWYIIPDPHRPGKKISKSCGTGDYAAAIKVKNDAITSRGGAKHGDPISVNDLLTDYRVYIEAEKTRSLRSIRSSIKRLRNALGHIMVDKLTTADANRFRTDRKRDDDVSDSTVNRELGYLRAAMKREMRNSPPRVTSVPYMPAPSEKDCVREGFIDRDDYFKILEEMVPALRAIFICAFHTGARSGELKVVRWDQVDFEEGLIQLLPRTTKNKDGRWIPIWGDMRDALLEQKRIRDRDFPDCPWVFFWPKGYHHRGVGGQHLTTFRHAWRTSVARAGYPGLLFHDLRRSAIKYADQTAKQSSKLVRMMSGHKTDAVYMRYNIGEAKDVAELGHRLDEFLRTQKRVVPIKTKRRA